MQQRKGGIVFAVVVGLLVAVWSYRWITDPAPREQRQLQETVVLLARSQVETLVAVEGIEIVDPLAPNRRVGKAYIYPLEDGWEVSGFYRKSERDLWHPYLVRLDTELELAMLKISEQNAEIVERAREDARIVVMP